MIGAGFLAQARAGIRDDCLPNGTALENTANHAVAGLVRDLEMTLAELAPSGSAGVMTAMLAATPGS